jgi:hypothetical protein
MLGFRGHFSTKSRAYSTTMGALRADRAAYQREPPSPPDCYRTSTATPRSSSTWVSPPSVETSS